MIALAFLAAAASQIEVARPSCTLANAERISFEAAIEGGVSGRCIAFRAVWSGNGLYPTHLDARRQSPRRIAVSAEPDLVARSLRPAGYTAVGFLRPGPILEASEMYRRRWPTAPARDP